MGKIELFEKLYLMSFGLVVTLRGSSPLPSNFYQQGPGAISEIWLSTVKYPIEDFNSIPDFPSCPTYAYNLNNFEGTFVYPSQRQHVRYRSIFVTPQTGKHRFFAICNNECQLYIELNPKRFTNILEIKTPTIDDWAVREFSSEVDLIKGFRYEVMAYHYGDGNGKNFFRLGVKFPDATEVKAINSSFLHRSVEHYKWNGLLAQKYDNFNFPSWDMYSLAYAYSNNPNYPNNPTSFMCKSTLYVQDQYKDFGNNYALRYIGYMKVPSSSSYQFKMWCNELCEFFITKNNVEASLGTFIIRDYRNPKSIIMDGGGLLSDVLYPIKAFMAESQGNDYIKIQYKHINASYSSSWNGTLQNLETVETSKSIPVPVLKMINSTAISVRLPSAPYLPPNDSWTYIPNHEMLYFRVGFENDVQRITLNGNLPQTFVATGLKKYTDYEFYAHYFGTIGGKDQNIISGGAIMKTDEDVPETAPPNLAASQQSSTSIKVTWGTFTNLKLWNGIGIGFEIQYRVKDATPNTWTPVLTSGVGNRQYVVTSLKKYTVYEFRVAGRTSKGSGVFGATIEERTAEHTPTAPPSAFHVSMMNRTTVMVHWNRIPKEHQNGVIISYEIWYREAGTNIAWNVVASSAFALEINEIEEHKIYDFKICGATRIGMGPFSESVKISTMFENQLVEEVPIAFVTSIQFSNKSLVKHIFKVVQVYSVQECFEQCLNCLQERNDCKCASFNLKHLENGEKGPCEINQESHEKSPSDFVDREGYQYYKVD